MMSEAGDAAMLAVSVATPAATDAESVTVEASAGETAHRRESSPMAAAARALTGTV